MVQEFQSDILAIVATLHSDVNNLLETQGTLERSLNRLEQQATPTEETLKAILAKITGKVPAEGDNPEREKEDDLGEIRSEEAQEGENGI